MDLVVIGTFYICVEKVTSIAFCFYADKSVLNSVRPVYVIITDGCL